MTIPGNVRSVALRGDEHTRLGEIAVDVIAPQVAIGLSRGKFPKGYQYLDPNEDAVFAATDGRTALLAVADGHSGFDAARAALVAVSRIAPLVFGSADRPHQALSAVLDAAHRAVASAVAAAEFERTSSRTGLAVALVSRDRMTVATFGDCSIAVVRGAKARQVGSFAPFLSGEPAPPSPAWGEATVHPGDCVVAATDGLIDFLGRGWKRILATLAGDADLATFVHNAMETAFAGGAGDNIAMAVWRREPTGAQPDAAPHH